MSAARLIQITPEAWVDPTEVLAVEAGVGGARVYMGDHYVYVHDRTVPEVLEALGRKP